AQRSERPQQLYPGIRELIDRLVERPEVLLGIATGKSRRGLDHLLESHAMTRCFISTQVADDHPSKPNPSMLLRILRETGMEAGQAVMVGDTEFDIEMGRAAGYRTIAVTWGYHPAARLRAAGADLLVD
ncbi:HAD family hydrolase, partial [Thioclava sp. BHET1]